MSILNCESCSEPIDTDKSPEMWCEQLEQWLCDNCYDEDSLMEFE